MSRKQGQIKITKGLIENAISVVTHGMIPVTVGSGPSEGGKWTCVQQPAAVGIATRGRLFRPRAIATSGWVNVPCIIEETIIPTPRVAGGQMHFPRLKRITIKVYVNGSWYKMTKVVPIYMRVQIEDVKVEYLGDQKVSIKIMNVGKVREYN